MIAPAPGEVTVTKRRTVLADGCLDSDPEVHQVLLGKVFPRQAEVTTIADWADCLHHAAPSADGH